MASSRRITARCPTSARWPTSCPAGRISSTARWSRSAEPAAPTPFTAAATALVDGSQRAAGRPPIGLANGWFYQAVSHPGAFYDITIGNNDLANVGCCQATVGYDLASGLGVPNWAVLPAILSLAQADRERPTAMTEAHTVPGHPAHASGQAAADPGR